MDLWTPLAPTKRASGQYARAKLVAGVAIDQSPAKPTSYGGRTRGSGVGLANDERTPLPPSDPFPPVGIFPRYVVLHILSFLSLADQRNCALAARSLASAVADERNWSRRLEALDWCKVDGLSLDSEEWGEAEEAERGVGRRRAAKAKSKESEEAEATTGAQVANAGKEAASAITALSIAEEDDFGDFSGPSVGKDESFGDFAFDRAPAGGSFASGTASVALGRGQAHPGLGSSSSQSLPPTKSGQAQRGPGALFSFSAETKLPLSSTSPSFRRLRTYAKALQPYLKSLADLSAPPTSSLLFTCDLGLSAQAALLSNLLRYISTSVGGCRRPVRRGDATFEHDEKNQATLFYRGQEAAQNLGLNLLSSFEGTLARRGDAVRAARHGADTARAIRRAEDDMRTHANGIWELGNARLALELSEKDDFAEDKEDLFGRMKAARTFLDRREVFSLGLRGHDPLDNVV